MGTRALREDLLAIDGVEGADVDGDDLSPTGLRIRVAQNADQKAVGEAIRRVLSAHGLGTDTPLPGEPPSDRPATQMTQMASVSELAAQQSDPQSEQGRVATLVAGDEPDMQVTADEQPDQVIDLTEEEPSVESLEEPQEEPRIVTTRTTLQRVSVDEGRDGVTVTVVASDGQVETERARLSEGGVEQAVVLATARLAAPGAPDPVVIEIDDRRIEGTDIVMIVLDNDGFIAAGSAVVGAGRAFALGRATWAAMVD